jgi:hypothetical protein
MFALRMKLFMAVLAWIATRFMRRLSFPALVIAIVLEVLFAVVHSAMSKKEKAGDSESIQHEGQRVELD